MQPGRLAVTLRGLVRALKETASLTVANRFYIDLSFFASFPMVKPMVENRLPENSKKQEITE